MQQTVDLILHRLGESFLVGSKEKKKKVGMVKKETFAIPEERQRTIVLNGKFFLRFKSACKNSPHFAAQSHKRIDFPAASETRMHFVVKLVDAKRKAAGKSFCYGKTTIPKESG